MLLFDSTKHDTAVIIFFLTELFEVKRKRDSRNKFFAMSSWESPVRSPNEREISLLGTTFFTLLINAGIFSLITGRKKNELTEFLNN